MKSAVIVGAARTPIGKFMGGLSGLGVIPLAATAVAEAVRRSGVDPSKVDELVLGNVFSSGLGANPARHVAFKAGLVEKTSGLLVNKGCGSGLAAVIAAAQAIRSGDAAIAVACGSESTSNAAHLVLGARSGLRLGHSELKDSILADGLWCPLTDQHVGNGAEFVAAEYRISREEQDAWTLESHRRATEAISQGRFQKEIVAVTVPAGSGQASRFEKDEAPRADASLASLAKLPPVFQAGGTVTAGNAASLSDGAAAVVVMDEELARQEMRPILARIGTHAYGVVEPKWMMMSQVRAVRQLLESANLSQGSLDLIEANEGFAAQAVAVTRVLKLDTAKVNVNGGSLALGHPAGAAGLRILVTLLHALEARNLARGLAVLSLTGGDGIALLVERPAN